MSDPYLKELKGTREPTPGKIWTVKPGDTYESLAIRAYGDVSKAKLIQENFNNKQLPLVVGEWVFIPKLPKVEKLKSIIRPVLYKGKLRSDGVTLVIDAKEFPAISVNVIRTMDTVSDAWSATLPWTPGLDKDFDRILALGKSYDAQVFLDGNLLVSGRLLKVGEKLTNQGYYKFLWGWSYTVDLIDSHALPPYEVNNVTLLQRCVELCAPHGIGVEVEKGLDISGPFPKLSIGPQETKFTHLAKLALQRKVILSSTVSGDLLITLANPNAPIVGTLEEGSSFVTEWEIELDVRKRFNTYRAVSQGPAKDTLKVGIAIDPTAPPGRIKTFSVDESTKGELKDIAEYSRNRINGQSTIKPLKVDTWNAPDGSFWRENTRVTVKTKIGNLNEGFTFLIRKVEYKSNDKGRSATLSLVPPGFYSDGMAESPW